MNIYEKLLCVQSELKAPKSQYNSFGKYNYRNCEDILEAAKPLCKTYNALVWLSDEVVLIGDRHYVKATATFVDVEKGEKLTAVAYAREEETKKGMDGSQVTGASSSYARKYALNGLFDIDDTKDNDTTNSGKKEKKEQPKEKTPRERLIERLHEKGIDVNEYARQHGLTSKTPPEVFEDLLADLRD